MELVHTGPSITQVEIQIRSFLLYLCQLFYYDFFTYSEVERMFQCISVAHRYILP